MNKLIDDPILQTYRLELKKEEGLMKQGVLTEPVSGRNYFTGYAYRTFYDWDQYFEAITQIYMGWPAETIKNGVMLFLDQQRDTGLISRSVPSNDFHDPEHCKPFLCQIALLIYRYYGELDWILREPYFSRLQRYLDYWLSEMDENHNGLSEWMSAPHTGMDNQHERAGYWLDRFCEGVDLNSYLVRELQAFSHLADLAGKPDLSADYACKSAALAGQICASMWDEGDGFFYDHNARAGEALMSRHAGWASSLNQSQDAYIRVKSASAFAALWAGVATPEQARRMVYEHLLTRVNSGLLIRWLLWLNLSAGTAKTGCLATWERIGAPRPGFPPTT